MKCVCYKTINYCCICNYWVCSYCDMFWFDPDNPQASEYICNDCFSYTFCLYKED